MRGDAVPEVSTVQENVRILVVDDEPHIRRVLSAMLGNRGWA